MAGKEGKMMRYVELLFLYSVDFFFALTELQI